MLENIYGKKQGKYEGKNNIETSILDRKFATMMGTFGYVIILYNILLFFTIFKIAHTEKIYFFETMFKWFRKPETKLKKLNRIQI